MCIYIIISKYVYIYIFWLGHLLGFSSAEPPGWRWKNIPNIKSYLDLPFGVLFMDDKGCRKPPSLRVQTNTRTGRCWYVNMCPHGYCNLFQHLSAPFNHRIQRRYLFLGVFQARPARLHGFRSCLGSKRSVVGPGNPLGMVDGLWG